MENKKLTTSEDYKRRIDLVVNYVREHLDSPIDLAILAELSGFSLFHFHRIAKVYLGEPIGAFIVRVRIETAAHLLCYSDLAISDIAYTVGYDIPSSLSRAFIKLFGISPVKFRVTKNYDILTRTCLNEEIELTQIVVELEPKTILYISAGGMYDLNVIESGFDQMLAEIKRQGISSIGIEHITLYHNNPQVAENRNIRYDICLRVCNRVEPNGDIGVKEIAGGKYAKFTYVGEYKKLGVVFDKIYGELLAKGKLVARGSYCFRNHVSSPYEGDTEKSITEIYVPIE